MLKRTLTLVLAILCLAIPSVAAAQGNTGTIRGTVSDVDGAGLPGVTVTARNEASGITQSLSLIHI